MSNQAKTGQKRHDDSVRRTVKWYRDQGFSVKADLPGEKNQRKSEGLFQM